MRLHYYCGVSALLLWYVRAVVAGRAHYGCGTSALWLRDARIMIAGWAHYDCGTGALWLRDARIMIVGNCNMFALWLRVGWRDDFEMTAR